MKRYVYYRCTHSKNLQCKEPSIREDVLIEQLLDRLDALEMDVTGVRKNLKEELEKFSKFSGVLGVDVEIKKKLKEIDGRKYAEYVLREGSTEERRALLENVKNNFFLKDGNVTSASVVRQQKCRGNSARGAKFYKSLKGDLGSKRRRFLQ